MKKKGFTLIELLAVIVILAIIALIATPLVLKYIEKSRKESKVDSAYSFVRNLETEIANYSIKNNGKKYNKAPIGGDYYEFKDFDADKDIDTTVKGDKPDTIKVCLSSLGQIEKAMFNFNDGKYYVLYDGKKSSISDKDTYDSFSCSGSGGNITAEEVFATNVTIEEIVDGSDTFYRGAITDIEQFDYDDKYYYNLYVDDKVYKVLFAWITYEGYGNMTTSVSSTQQYVYADAAGQIMMIGADDSTVGPHRVRLEKTNEKVYPHAVKVGNLTSEISDKDFRIHIISRELQNVDTNVVVKDVDGNIIKEATLKANSENIQPGNYLTFITYSVETYELVKQGKIITVEVTQEIDGKSVTTILGGEKFDENNGEYSNNGCELRYAYYWGNGLVPAMIGGC